MDNLVGCIALNIVVLALFIKIVSFVTYFF